MQRTIKFILASDSSAARRLRRIIATQTPCMGVQIGTWSELIEQSRRAYLIPKQPNDWSQIFHHALENVSDAFWSQSLEVAPQETAAEVEAALSLLIGATQPGDEDGIAKTDLDQLPERPRKHVKDLLRLRVKLAGRLPEELEAIQQLMIAESSSATIRKLVVCHVDQFPVLTRWQEELINKLNKDADAAPDAALLAALESLQPAVASSAPESSLEFIQKHMFSAPDEKTSLDNSVQWLGVRDYLLPDTFEYSLAVNDAFTTAGVPLSGLPVDHWQRDLGKEALFHFLYCRQKPSPAMALAVCLSSPLMPWTKEQGAVLAQTVMDGDYQLRAPRSATQSDRKMLALLREGDENPETLITAIRAFVELLDGSEQFDAHVYQARLMAEELCAALEGRSDIDWRLLRRLSSPKNISTGESPDFNLDGVTVWREGHEPWRPVRYLIVLGFASGRYPLISKDSAVFVSENLVDIRKKLKLPIATPAEQMRGRRAQFKRQLGAVSDSLTFMIPRRDPTGASQSPSESLVFMSQLYRHVDEAESLILEIDVGADRERMQYLPAVEVCHASSLRDIVVEDIHFDIDLLALRTDEEGNLRPESPSSLETLMVSPFAWLLRRINAEPLGWEPERLNVMLQGTLTHQVFEKLFQASSPIPEPEAINSKIEPFLDSAIRTHAPFLRAAQWQVERKHLATSIKKAALAWRVVLTKLNAEVLGTEEWLAGTLDGLPIHGQADILLSLPDNQLLVVDYKKSSATSRRPRMKNGYDSQANLYRTMLQTGGLKRGDNTALLKKLRTANATGIVYFMTNDQTFLTDVSDEGKSGVIPGWEVLKNDVSQRAMELINKRLQEVRKGRLDLNREGDGKFFDKQAGVKPYALDNSALISLFTISGEAREPE